MITYLQDRFDWHIIVFESIWWPIHKQALAKFPPINRLVIQKFNMDHWACNHREAVRGDDTQKWCEMCFHHEETTDHIVQCTHCHRLVVKDKLITDLGKYFTKTGTPPAMRKCIMSGLLSWFNGIEAPPLNKLEPNASPTLTLAYTTQHTIGWRHFLKGRLSIHWATLINGEPKVTNHETANILPKSRKMNPATWGCGLLRILWKYVLEFWKVRNETLENIYKVKGITKPHHILIRQAMQEQQTGEVGYNEQDWMLKSPDDFKQMDMLSIKLWIRRVRAAKKQFKVTMANNQQLIPLVPT